MEQNQNPTAEQQPHKRRVRYKGTHPRKFEEKYKELNPEKYGNDVEKIIGQGKTPAGMHISIMVDEILDFLQIQPGQIGYDATLGYGGHSRRMLEKLQGEGHLYATDIDPIESEKTRQRLADLGFGPEILTIKRMNFADLDKVAPDQKFDFILADLGVSSMQIDNPARGFTFKADGPLDLRLDPSTGVTAAERLRELDYHELIGLLVENSDEPYAEQIAKEIQKTYRRGGDIETTRQLYAVIEQALSFLPKKELKQAVKKSCQRTFQALRIDVNSEFEVLYSFLDKLPDVLAPGGRVAVLTFHSGEDRLVKQAFKQGVREGVYSDAARDVIRPSAEECFRNPRATSTKMRWAIRSK
ncbi:MAG: 16S rRNA (cytosine(1402)-N(4))-methyltransferase RsmH [Oscillospiraceae bacterium]|nr:16S rRNA (cytosine(1402)-N(4))-methyltransferase RsmH [Oscillospiraceae bacterium]